MLRSPLRSLSFLAAPGLAAWLPLPAFAQEAPPSPSATEPAAGSAPDSGPAEPEASDASQQAPHELEELVVRGKLVAPSAAPSSTKVVVSEEELERQEDNDIHQVLLRVPGVQIRGEDGLGLRPNIGIRGTNPNRSQKVVLMEDGVLLGPAPYSAPAAYYFPLVTRMTGVEVQKGGASLLYGPRAMGGSVNLVTAAIPDSWGAMADVSYGQFGYFKLHGRTGWSNERTGFLLEGVELTTTGFKELDGGGNTGFDKREFMAKWRISSAPDAEIYQELQIKLGFATEDSKETYLGLTDADFAKNPYRRYSSSQLDRMQWQRGQFQATYVVYPSDKVEIVTTAYRNQFTRDWFKSDAMGGAGLDEVLRNPNSAANQIYYDVLSGQADSSGFDDTILEVDNYRWFISQGVQSRLTTTFDTGGLHHSLESGLRYHYDEANRRHTHHPYNMVGSGADSFSHPVDANLPPIPLAYNQGQTHAITPHMVDTIKVKNWTLTPGVRAEFIWTKFTDHLDASNTNKTAQLGVIPGMGAHYAISEDWGTFAGVYRGYGPTAPQGMAPGTQAARAEWSTNFEMGGRYSGSMAYVEASAYWNQYDNLSASCTQSSSCESSSSGTQFNGGKASVYGLEAIAQAEPHYGAFAFPLRATYALTFSRFGSSFASDNPEWGNVQKGDELTYLPRHQGSVLLAANYQERAELGFTTTFVTATREVAGQGKIPTADRTDPYALLGLSGRFFFTKGISAYGNISNLLNSAYLVSRRPHGARPGAPRWIQVGLKFEH